MARYRRRRRLSFGKLLWWAFIAVMLFFAVRAWKNGDFNALTGSGKETSSALLYDTICEGIASHETSIELGNVADPDGIDRVYTRVLNDHPEFFWLDGDGEINGLVSVAYKNYTLKLSSICSEGQITAMEKELNAVLEEIRGGVPAQGSERDKALYVHDYIIEHCEYDQKAAANPSPEGEELLAFTSYGCLVNGSAVCQGYAKAFQLVMKALGTECEYMWGTADNRESAGDHSWNYIKLDGMYYMVDVTWDDPVNWNGDSISRDYFCLSPEEMAKDHFLDPECGAVGEW